MKTPLGPVSRRRSLSLALLRSLPVFFSHRHSTVSLLARWCQIISSLSHHAYVWSMVLAGREGKDFPARASWFFERLRLREEISEISYTRWLLFVSREKTLIFVYHYGVFLPLPPPSSLPPPLSSPLPPLLCPPPSLPFPSALNFGLTSRRVLLGVLLPLGSLEAASPLAILSDGSQEKNWSQAVELRV